MLPSGHKVTFTSKWGVEDVAPYRLRMICVVGEDIILPCGRKVTFTPNGQSRTPVPTGE